jgi:hypothetical protein
MQMVYNSENFVVVQFDLPFIPEGYQGSASLQRGGYEIVDKFAGKEIYIDGLMAESFKEGVNALIEQRSASEEEMDDYIERYTCLMQQPVVQH